MLALLALRAGEIVATEVLITAVWGETPPRTAPTSLQNAISQLRKALGAGSVVTRPPGYVLAIDTQQVDAPPVRATARERAGARRRDHEPLLRGGLQLWRGPPLADFTYESVAQDEIARLEERRLAAAGGA